MLALVRPDYGEALALAERAHAGQVDKAGAPYIEHVQRVARSASSMALMFGLSDEAVRQIGMAAVLHDVVEDTDVTLDDLRADGYPAAVVEMVRLLTRDRSLSYRDWIASIAASGNLAAIIIKFADNRDNSDPLRLARVPGGQEALLRRYRQSMEILASAAPHLLNGFLPYRPGRAKWGSAE